MTEAEYANLKESIRNFGVKEAVVYDEDGNILDGHNRLKICKELKIKDYPSRIEIGLSEIEKRDLVLSLNINRRSLNRKQKRQIVYRALKATPKYSNSWIAQICGVDVKTVVTIRAKLVSTQEIPGLEKLLGRDGKMRKNTVIQVPRKQMLEKGLNAAKTLGDDAPKHVISLSRAKRLAAKKQHEDRDLKTDVPRSYRLFHCHFERLPEKADLKPDSVDLIYADPPYTETELYDKVGEFAKTYLKDGGVLVAYAPTDTLPQIYSLLGKHLTYFWQAGFCFSERKLFHKEKIATCYRPVILMTKGTYTPEKPFFDMLTSQRNTKDKSLHPWQQPIESVRYYIESLSKPGSLIVEPFGGSFTGAAACKDLGDRQYIGCDIEEQWVKVGTDRLTQKVDEEEDWGDVLPIQLHQSATQE